eukprot:GDKJ01003091.1.p1 GENE.GDKJ01003091.1~~GDKJ01003091.1.p1  ORF type:complete len:1038 (+),score=325.47 GDKJ01003091.1:259-3114(+)
MRKLAEELSLEKNSRIAIEATVVELRNSLEVNEKARTREVSCLKGALEVAKTRGNSDAQRLNSELESATFEVANLKATVEDLKNEKKNTRETLETQIRVLDVSLMEMKSEKDKMQFQLEQAKSKALLEAEETQQLAASQVALKSQISSLETDLKVSVQLNNENKILKDKQDQQLATLKSQLEDRDNTILTLKKSNDDIRKVQLTQASQLKSQEERLVELSASKERVSKNLSVLESSYETLKTERDALFETASELKRKIGTLERSSLNFNERHKTELENERQRLEQVVLSAEKEHVITRSHLAETRRALENALHDLKQKEQENSRLRNSLGSEEGSSSSIKIALRDAETSLSLERQKNEKMESKIENLERDLSACLAKYTESEGKKSAFERESVKMKSEITSLKDSLKILKSQVEDLTTRLKKSEPLALQSVTLEKENEILVQRLAESERWVHLLNRNVAAAEHALRSEESRTLADLRRLLTSNNISDVESVSSQIQENCDKMKYIDSLKTQVMNLTTELHDARRKVSRLRVAEEELKVFSAFFNPSSSTSSSCGKNPSSNMNNGEFSSSRRVNGNVGGATSSRSNCPNTSQQQQQLIAQTSVESMETKRLRRDTLCARSDLLTVTQLASDLLALLSPPISSVSEELLQSVISSHPNIDAETIFRLADDLKRRLSTAARSLSGTSSAINLSSSINFNDKIGLSAQYLPGGNGTVVPASSVRRAAFSNCHQNMNTFNSNNVSPTPSMFNGSRLNSQSQQQNLHFPMSGITRVNNGTAFDQKSPSLRSVHIPTPLASARRDYTTNNNVNESISKASSNNQFTLPIASKSNFVASEKQVINNNLRESIVECIITSDFEEGETEYEDCQNDENMEPSCTINLLKMHNTTIIKNPVEEEVKKSKVNRVDEEHLMPSTPLSERSSACHPTRDHTPVTVNANNTTTAGVNGVVNPPCFN